MSRRFPRPDKSTPVLESDGKTINQAWFDYLGYIDGQIQMLMSRGLGALPDVEITSLANNQVLIWNSTDSKWENGAN